MGAILGATVEKLLEDRSLALYQANQALKALASGLEQQVQGCTQALQAALTVAEAATLATGSAAAKASTFVLYPDAPHAFHADYRPSYRKGPADDGWQRALAWFKTHGVA